MLKLGTDDGKVYWAMLISMFIEESLEEQRHIEKECEHVILGKLCFERKNKAAIHCDIRLQHVVNDLDIDQLLQNTST